MATGSSAVAGLPAGYTLEAQQAAPQQGGVSGLPAGYTLEQSTQSNDPTKTGEITNDVGQKVIVPKDGESFADTLKRAVAYHKSLTPEQQHAALSAETKTIPAKTAQTLAGAATAGVVGPAALAIPGEIAGAVSGGTEPGLQTFEAAKSFASSPAGQDLIKLVLKHAGEAVLTGSAGYLSYEGIHKAAKLLGLGK